MSPTSATYEFLSPDWIAAARAARVDEGDAGPAPVAFTMNLSVTEVPFGESPLLVQLDTGIGVLALDEGHRASADITITVDWATAKALLLDGDSQAAMSAFMAGKVRVQGDMSKLVAMQNAPLSADSQRVIERLRSFTS